VPGAYRRLGLLPFARVLSVVRGTALLADGNLGSAVAFARSLGRAGWRVLAPSGTIAAASRFSEPVELPDVVANPKAFRRRLVQLVAGESVAAVVPCSDASSMIAWELADELGGARIIGGDASSVRRFLHKPTALAEADEHGFPTPRWQAPSALDELVDAAEQIGLPCVLKPCRSYSYAGERLERHVHVIVRTREQLAGAARRTTVDGELPIVQAYVPGRALGIVAVLAGGRVVAGVARETFSYWPVVGGGTSVWRRTVGPEEPGVRAAYELLIALRYEGLADVEYHVARESGLPCLMEIGVRAPAGIELAIAAGVDLPLVAVLAAFDRVGEGLPLPYRPGVDLRWPAGEAARIVDALNPRTPMPPNVRRHQAIARAWPLWQPGMRYDRFDLGDPGPWLPFGRYLLGRRAGASRTRAR
jgi:predicted ATP-grasp superfamily ATP-dependent carboligase